MEKCTCRVCPIRPRPHCYLEFPVAIFSGHVEFQLADLLCHLQPKCFSQKQEHVGQKDDPECWPCCCWGSRLGDFCLGLPECHLCLTYVSTICLHRLILAGLSANGYVEPQGNQTNLSTFQKDTWVFPTFHLGPGIPACWGCSGKGFGSQAEGIKGHPPLFFADLFRLFGAVLLLCGSSRVQRAGRGSGCWRTGRRTGSRSSRRRPWLEGLGATWPSLWEGWGGWVDVQEE